MEVDLAKNKLSCIVVVVLFLLAIILATCYAKDVHQKEREREHFATRKF